jgi:hypothetical protein
MHPCVLRARILCDGDDCDNRSASMNPAISMKRGSFQVWGFSLSLLMVSVAHSAHAQAGNKAAAEALFDEGRRLMAADQFAAACAKFEASQALDPGVGTSLNLADCYEKSGRTASAWAQFRETMSAAHKAGSSERERIARQHVQSLEPKLSYLTIATWKGQDVQVTRDGITVDAAVLGTAIPVDPGEHVVAASAANKRAWSTTVSVGATADRISVAVPILPDEPVAAELPTPPLTPAPAPVATLTTSTTTSRTDSNPGATQRTIAIVTAAVGVVGIATGTVFGIKTASTWSDAKADCHPYPHCSDAGRKLSQDAQSSGTISTVAFIVGGLGIAAGAVLWFTAPSRSETQVSLAIGPGSVDLHGRF